ncbi:MAG: phosphoribosylamine--glycine ligase [Candidatus Omnitrophica bacterium]|nr:phosphoribosylamine--glycine ligase [Candidatus Omnitrophota bacterium]MBU3933143.1 phosphoribosylamine--glycine ligase [Candidatus Omnitrophota bacterium]MBU4141189.1 phosphoribosylamine--glycine ligase [Candidatus Omnitrophota bacterium]
MKVLIIGSGGREHCLAWKIAQSDRVKEIFCAPGNGGTQGLARNVQIAPDNIKALGDFAREEGIDLTVVGPELPLVKGIVDEFQGRGLKVFGPRRQLALLEGSKVFAKEAMAKFALPTADFRIFSAEVQAADYIRQKGAPIVVKADGLAGGKGVFVCGSVEEALKALKAIMVDKKFGKSGNQIVIEDCLQGEEASVLVFSDGKNIVPLASSQDHKRIYDGELGANTGGMGAYSPAPAVTDVLEQKVNTEILQPLLCGLNNEGKIYVGMLYLGLMLTEGGPKVLEFNVRFGDPETQAILPRLKNDLVQVMLATIEGNLDKITLLWDSRPCVCVVVVSGGYPQDYEKGKQIFGLQEAAKVSDAVIFHAGTKKENENYFTSGGRVLNVAALGDTLEKAKARAYEAIEKINFENMYFRRDIGWRALTKPKKELI